MTWRREATARDPKASDNLRKDLGAFYTPLSIVGFLADWAIRSPNDRILEPAAGDGNFVRGAASRLESLGRHHPVRQLFAVELLESEALAITSSVPAAEVHNRSFFEISPSDLPKMDVVIGNPPYVRFHRFTGVPRELGRARATALKVDLSGLASSWAHFVVHSSAFLDDQSGRLGLVLPAELLHADYAEPVRDFLVRRFESVTIVAFDRRAFHPALVDAVLVLCDRSGPKGLHIWRLTDPTQLSQDNLLGGPMAMNVLPRWSSALGQEAARLYGGLLEQNRFCRLGSIASVDIGVVTGANSFFILSEGDRTKHGLRNDIVVPIVERGRHVNGLRATASETRWLVQVPKGYATDLDATLAEYLRDGESRGVDTGYKTSRRKPWWSVPTPQHRTDLLLPYMHSTSPRLIANPNHYWSSNLVHGVRLLESANALAVAAASLSSATSFSAEVEGRVYGGGVLKLEPSEAERLLLPRLSPAEVRALLESFEALDILVRAGRRDEASRLVDRILGIDHMPLAGAAKAFQDRRRELSRSHTDHRDVAEPT